jgi:hypothetical protein
MDWSPATTQGGRYNGTWHAYCGDNANVALETNGGSPAGPTRRELLALHTWTPSPPSDASCYACVTAAYNYLTELVEVCPQYVVLYGKLMRSAPSCWVG